MNSREQKSPKTSQEITRDTPQRRKRTERKGIVAHKS